MGVKPATLSAVRAGGASTWRWLGVALAMLMPGAGAAGAEPDGVQPRRVELCAPLTTIVHAARACVDPLRLEATVVVPPDAPADLGVSAFVADAHGRWFRSVRTRTLTPGRQRLDFPLDAQADLIGEPHRAAWTASARSMVADAGLFLWSDQSSRAAIVVERLELVAAPSAVPASAPSTSFQLRDLRIDGLDARAGVARGRTGERWTLSARPTPFPQQPYQEDFALAAVIAAPDGKEWRIDAFYRQPLAIVDRGDREVCTPTAAGGYEVRFRPGLPGRYAVRLEARWAGQAQPVVTPLPELVVDGDPWDDYVRVDPADARFFSTGSRIGAPRFYWPVGLNLHSVWDTLSHDSFGTRLTPHRLWAAYEAYLRRFAAHGGTAVEIWLASWSLSLEWRGDWDGFHGIGRYNEENAERLDRVLDLAYRLGIRVNLVINNHGQASIDEDREWEDNPYNAALGGPLARAAQYFTDRRALAGQERYRRYIVARWADHPAVLGWKLWSEQNLTEGRSSLRGWHERAAARWQQLDGYGHPLTTHWCSTYRDPDPAIVRQPGMGYICIDAYHGRGSMLAQLVWDSLCAEDGLGWSGKPILITEFGGDCKTCPQPQLIAEHRSAPWAGLVSGNAGSPMLWWSEWVDQREQWSPYAAIGAFIAGEDLRGPVGRAAVIAASGGTGALWSRAWVRPGRILGYCLDRDWGVRGTVDRRQDDVVLRIGEQVPAGTLALEWWDADDGRRLASETIAHAGGALDLRAPAFSRHLAYKLSRATPSSAPAAKPD